jgi:hypothetical protein
MNPEDVAQSWSLVNFFIAFIIIGVLWSYVVNTITTRRELKAEEREAKEEAAKEERYKRVKFKTSTFEGMPRYYPVRPIKRPKPVEYGADYDFF